MPFAHRIESGLGGFWMQARILRWVCVVVLGLAIGMASPGHGFAASKQALKKGAVLTKGQEVITLKKAAKAGGSKSKLRHDPGKTSKAKAKHGPKKKQTTMKERVRAKRVTQARLLARVRPPRSRAAQAREAAEEVRNVEIPPMDLWQIRAYEQDLAVQADEQPVDEGALRIIETANNYLGTPYRYGGTTPEGFDCSGFVRHVFGENGINLKRTSYEQFRQGKAIPLSAMRPGDLIFFGRVKREHCRIEHVGLYIGEGRYIHAASSRSGQVTVSQIKSPEQGTRKVMARRILDHAPFEPQL
ncbi:MAG TPA: C40 family peptidase [Deltaproteobacteria bacterium]|nr:C40 family peptidase [Deltaproteobacteria bacterium]